MQVTQNEVGRPPGPYVVDLSVEFAHVYADEAFGPEHLAAAEEARLLREELETSGLTYSLSVLIDDYNPLSPTLNVAGFVRQLSEHGPTPDHVVLEGSLIENARSFLAGLNGREGRGLRRYIESRGRFPCALLLAVWHLVRLGAMPLPPTSEMRGACTNPLVGEESLTILPSRFTSVEHRALELIALSPYAHLGARIKHKFF